MSSCGFAHRPKPYQINRVAVPHKPCEIAHFKHGLERLWDHAIIEGGDAHGEKPWASKFLVLLNWVPRALYTLIRHSNQPTHHRNEARQVLQQLLYMAETKVGGIFADFNDGKRQEGLDKISGRMMYQLINDTYLSLSPFWHTFPSGFRTRTKTRLVEIFVVP